MSLKTFVSGALLLLVVFSQSAFAIGEHDAAQNDPTWQQEYANVGMGYSSDTAMYGWNGTGWVNIGTATAISPHCAIGAAHCALGNNGQMWSKFAMVTGNNLKTDYWGIYYATSVAVNPNYTGIGSTDLAIWTFSDTLDVTPAKLYQGPDSALLGNLVDSVGFGYLGFASTGAVPGPIDGQKRGCQNILDEIGYPPFGYGTDQLVTFFAAPGSSEYQHLGGCLADLDSGGGMFLDGASTPTLVGVDAWTVNSLGYGVPTGATSVSQNMAWINSVVPEPGTFAMLGVAAVTLLLYWKRRR